MGRWFRFYDDAVNDPKIIKLSDDIFRAWVNLLCVASKNEGVLPATDDIAIILRVKVARAAAIIAELVSFGLLDKTEAGFAPHNWNGRQYKSDVSTERVKRFRNGKRNVSETSPESEQKQTTEQIDKIVEGASAFTEGSKALASALWKALGHTTPISIPPELAGIDWRAIEWERAGWTADLIDAEARRVGPGKPLTYYEKVFATSFAKRQAPLPVVEIKQSETVTVTHGRTKETRQSLPDAARRLAENGISFGPKPELPTLRSITGSSDVRLLPQSRGERPGDIRSGSVGSLERLPAGGDRLHHGPEDGAAEQIEVVAERVRGPAGM